MNKSIVIKKSDSRIKSLLKGISWRIVGTCDTIIIAYLITGEIKYALGIGSVEVLSKIIVFYLHERAWQLIPDIDIKKFFSREIKIKTEA